MSLPADVKKAYGIVMALGTKLGERARDEATLLDELRGARDRLAFLALVRAKGEGRAPAALFDSFDALVTDADWIQWRARLLIQARMTKEGKERVPGHEEGRGVGRP